MTQSRQPPGVPAGGQFAPGAKPRSGVNLGDSASGLDDVALAFRERGFDPEEAERWTDRNFTAGEVGQWSGEQAHPFHPEDAADWRDEGFDASAASDWRDQGFDAATASAIHGVGVDAVTARAYTDAYVTSPEAIRDFREYGIDPTAAQRWSATLAEHGIEPEWTGQTAGEWSTMTPERTATWMDNGVNRPWQAREWDRLGFTPEQAGQWSNANFEAAEAKLWANHGFTPERADYYATRGTPPELALDDLKSPRCPLPETGETP